MKALTQMPEAVRASIRGVFTDIDDTLTTDGRLPAEAYRALERLHQAGYVVVPITGRPAGWCDLIARMWPVHGVVGENGAFFFAYDSARKTMRRHFRLDEATRADNRIRLQHVGEQIIRDVKGAAISADQRYRESDLAIDYREDVAPLDSRAVERIVAHFERAGATAKVSSIHVNGWFGRFDKLSMTRELMRIVFDCDLSSDRDRYVFIGDSPNDQSMFEFFPHCVGVANLAEFQSTLCCKPAYLCDAPRSGGFVELTDYLLGGGP